MKRPGLIAILIMFLGSMSGTSSSQAANKAEIESIDAYCKTVDAIQDKTAGLVFADTAGLNDDTPKWRGFASEKALEKFREDSDTYSIAYNWRKGTKIVASNFTLFSDSGDWAKYVYHCFREDGSLVPKGAARLGVCQGLSNIRSPRRRATELASLLQLAPTSC
jgi:hypothetical protein